MNFSEFSMLLAGASLTGAAIAELVARSYLRKRGQYFVRKPNTTTILEIDQETLPDLESRTRFSVNNDGERGDEPPSDWSDAMRVLVAGGSAAECYLLDQESSWPQVMQRRLEAESEELGVSKVHVGNVSRSLVPCEYIELMLRKTLPRYGKVDLIILMVGASDVVNWLEKKTPSVIEPGHLKVDNAFDVHPEGPFGWTLATMALRRVLSRWYRALAQPVELKKGAGKTIGRNREMRARAKKMLNIVPDSAPMIEYFEGQFQALLEAAQEKADRVLVVRQPWFAKKFTAEERHKLWNFGAGRPYVEEVTIYYTHRVVNDLMLKIDQCVHMVSKDLEVEHVDLMPHLDRDFETYYDYLHFTPKGARVVGELVAETVLGRPPAEPVSEDETEQAPRE